MAAWLTTEDEANYGRELLDVAQRSALHALAPTLQQIQEDNAQLRQRLAQEARHRLDQQVAAEVPDYQTIDRDPRWHQWLSTVDPLSGRVRQTLLNDAISSGSAARVRAFFDGFRREAGNQSSGSTATTSGRTRSSSSGRPTYTRAQIAKFYNDKRLGAYVGREAEWARLEHELIAAGRENRILGAIDWHGK
jgi:hypothetical protein